MQSAPGISQLDFTHQTGIAVLTVFAMDYLKRSNWFPWISNNTEILNRSISLCIALATSIGLRVISSQGGFSTGGVITIAYPSVWVVLDTLTHAATQYGSSEVLQKLLGNHNMNKQILQLLQQLQPPKETFSSINVK